MSTDRCYRPHCSPFTSEHPHSLHLCPQNHQQVQLGWDLSVQQPKLSELYGDLQLFTSSGRAHLEVKPLAKCSWERSTDTNVPQETAEGHWGLSGSCLCVRLLPQKACLLKAVWLAHAQAVEGVFLWGSLTADVASGGFWLGLPRWNVCEEPSFSSQEAAFSSPCCQLGIDKGTMGLNSLFPFLS